jgi:hypothetical protein
MWTTKLRHHEVVIETSWKRLHRIAEARRIRLGLTQAGVRAVGGPSPAWINKLARESGPPSQRHAASLKDLDLALQWPEGTAWGLLTDDRSGWDESLLMDEEHQLVEETHDEADTFGFLVATRLRAIPKERRDEVMRAILHDLDMPRC